MPDRMKGGMHTFDSRSFPLTGTERRAAAAANWCTEELDWGNEEMLARECFIAGKSSGETGASGCKILPYPDFIHSGSNIDFTSTLLHVRLVKHATPRTLESALLARAYFISDESLTMRPRPGVAGMPGFMKAEWWMSTGEGAFTDAEAIEYMNMLADFDFIQYAKENTKSQKDLSVILTSLARSMGGTPPSEHAAAGEEEQDLHGFSPELVGGSAGVTGGAEGSGAGGGAGGGAASSAGGVNTPAKAPPAKKPKLTVEFKPKTTPLTMSAPSGAGEAAKGTMTNAAFVAAVKACASGAFTRVAPTLAPMGCALALAPTHSPCVAPARPHLLV